MKFYLGTHKPGWLSRFTTPMFVSHRTLGPLKREHARAKGRWALDSGGFSELTLFGKWQTKPKDYVHSVRRYMDEIGNMDWAAIQDWMCEPWLIAKTKLTVVEHQRRTVESLLTLRSLAPEVPWTPVLQGWEIRDYWKHVEMYERAGVTLRREPIVGVGSVCRRQHTDDAVKLICGLRSAGVKLHGFGFKLRGLERVKHDLASADSLAWSFRARRSPPLPGCDHAHCQHCPRFARKWYRRIQGILAA